MKQMKLGNNERNGAGRRWGESGDALVVDKFGVLKSIRVIIGIMRIVRLFSSLSVSMDE